MGITASSWDKFAVPVLFMTGTRDYGQGQRAASWRGSGFEKVRAVDDYLLTIEGATHFTFAMPDGAGGLFARKPDGAQTHHDAELIDSIGTEFFDAYLRDDPKAKTWLREYFASKHDDCTARFAPGAVQR
jgi:predicted dienelactone hydrolase